MSDEGIFENVEIDFSTVETGHELEKKAVAPAKRDAIAIPDKITKEWIDAQVPRKIWSNKKDAINPYLILTMHKLVRKGLSKKAVCARVGLNVNTWTKWEKAAAQDIEPYATWYKVMLHASGDLEAELLSNVRNAAIDDWKAATWLLGKINREEYAENKGGGGITNINVEGDAVEKKQTVNAITEDSAQKIANIMGKIGALPPGPVVDAEVVEDE
jgi:transcriptional regulator with XRE-family HTH domain